MLGFNSMNKSQLRKLAIRRAQGGLKLEEYQRRRRDLITDIVDGTLAVVREAPPPRPTPESLPEASGVSPETLVEQSRANGLRSIPLHYYFAGAASFCILILIWALWPNADQSATGPVTASPPVQQISPTRTLVESFLALRDYSELSVNDFENSWQHISDQDRDQARTELWFRSLTRSIRDEVKTQRALAQITTSEDTTAKIDRLYQLGETLEITHQLPTRSQATTTVTATDSTETESTTSDQPAEINTAAQDNVAAEQTETQETSPTVTGPKASPSETATAREWLAAQSAEDFSLQIFAVNKLAKVEQLITLHPDYAFQILATASAQPKFRVYLGSYPDKAQAAVAFTGLPDDVKKATGQALIKSFADIRKSLEISTTLPPAVAASSSASEQYTLQLFASDNRDNAHALTQQFSALNLELHEISDSPSAYRVLHGRYASPELAKQARDQLPADLLGRIGKPLIKSLEELGLKP